MWDSRNFLNLSPVFFWSNRKDIHLRLKFFIFFITLLLYSILYNRIHLLTPSTSKSFDLLIFIKTFKGISMVDPVFFTFYGSNFWNTEGSTTEVEFNVEKWSIRFSLKMSQKLDFRVGKPLVLRQMTIKVFRSSEFLKLDDHTRRENKIRGRRKHISSTLPKSVLNHGNYPSFY